MTMELTKRYIHAVTQKLPEGQRADIEKELQGLIEDMLEERLMGADPTEQDVEAVLLELGDPSELADRYRGHQRYLISPEMFNTYWTIVKTMLFAVGIAMLVVFIIDIISSPAEILKHLSSSIASFFMGALQGFAWVTIIFALVEYSGIQKEKLGTRRGASWKPADLPPLPDHRVQIKRMEPIISIIFIILFTALASVSSDLFGIWYKSDSSSTVVPFLDAEVLSGFLPYIWIAAALSIVNETLKAIIGRWSFKLIGLEAVISVAQFVLVLLIFSDSSIWNPQPLQQLLDANWVAAHSEEYAKIAFVWERATDSIIAIAGVIFAIQLVAIAIKAVKLRKHMS
jgi:hypothetical protein